jgi:hypothetical protein
MEKNNYVKPTMVVVELKHRARLLDGSSGGPEPGGAPRLYDWNVDVEAELSE